MAIKPFIGDKLAINEDFVDKLADIMAFLKQNPRVKGSIIAQFIGMSASNTRNYLNCLVLLDLIKADGANKNRVYLLNED